MAAALPATVCTAHHGVEAVLNAVERLGRSNEHAVNLRFEIGGSDLSVHVELRGEQVHTTFRTDSAELRATLSNEWQSLTGGTGGERSARLAPAVFTSTDQGSSRFTGDSPTPQRDPEAFQRDPSWPRTARSAAASTTANVTTSPVARAHPPGAVHLHTRA